MKERLHVAFLMLLAACLLGCIWYMLYWDNVYAAAAKECHTHGGIFVDSRCIEATDLPGVSVP